MTTEQLRALWKRKLTAAALAEAEERERRFLRVWRRTIALTGLEALGRGAEH